MHCCQVQVTVRTDHGVFLLRRAKKMDNKHCKTMYNFRSYKLQIIGAMPHVALCSLNFGKPSAQSSGTPSQLLLMHFF
ncbi:hypothetical protein GUJ93_ZPchr0009g1741 [Zizania palustris]|uniref:Uncharacterized protein n=1 Tax=Zizania palustris TaxID=103762 RepID=A0A8J5R3G1_ZIZPA|nr:hypothetical protein GUJ93_ZPchr0009g1741 [Zizania palustris]